MQETRSIWAAIRSWMGKAALGIAMVAAPTFASGSTIDLFVPGSTLVTASGLDVIADDFFIEANDVATDASTFVSAPLDGAGGLDTGFTAFGDLLIVDPISLNDLLVGQAVDLAVDFLGDTVSILYDVSDDPFDPFDGVNALSGDGFVLAVLSFQTDLIETGFTFDALDFETADAEIFGAAVIPLPASLPLMIAGLAVLVAIRRRKK